MQDSTPAAKQARAYGRSLSDFTTITQERPRGLWPAEGKLLECVRKGEPCEIAKERPTEPTEDNRIDAAFLRFLLLAGDETAPVHEKGVWLEGAYIHGDIDLENCLNIRPFVLLICHIAGELLGRRAQFASLNLGGSYIRGIKCYEANVIGAVFLGSRFEVEEAVNFQDAKIGGRFNCTNGNFKNAGGFALSCDGIRVTGSVLLRRGFQAEGEVRFSGSDIGGTFACNGGSFKNLQLRPNNNNDVPPIAHDALSLQAAKIRGSLWLGPGLPPNHQNISFEGSVNLQGAYAQNLVDNVDSWPKRKIRIKDQKISSAILLDGFTYDRLLRGAPTDAKTRKDWLLRQPQNHLTTSFRPQPFEQLIKVLKAMGHNRAANEIAYYKEYYRSRRPWRHWRKWDPILWSWYALRWLFLEKALGYGYYTHRMILLAVAIWAGFALIYDEAADQGLFAPASPFVVMNKTLTNEDGRGLREDCVQNGKPRWTSEACRIGEIMPEYTKFSPWAYSTDIILPIVSFKQEADWQPIYRPMQFGAGDWSVETPSGFLRFLVWFEAIFAWVWTLSLSAVATGIIKRD